MTATQPSSPVCPECGGTATMVLSDGMARCFDDQHEWDPQAVTAIARPQQAPEPPPGDPDVLEPVWPETPVLPPFAMASVEEVFGPPPGVEVDTAPAGTDELIGGTARLEGGQVATVLSFPDADHVVVRTNDGRDETVPLGDVEHITPRAPAYVIDPAPEPPVTAGWIADVEALSNIIIQAGVFTIEYGEAGASVGPPPPAGWLPRDASSNALVEAAAALAVARLVIAYELDVDDILEGVQAKQAPVEGDQPTEVDQ